jgi:hypothetical protein
MAIPADATTFIDGVLKGIGAPVNANTVQGFVNWLANEQGGPNLTSFEANKGNPLGVMDPAGQAAGKAGNVQGGINATVANLMSSNYTGLVSAFRAGTSSEAIDAQVVASPWNGNRYGGAASFNAVASGGTATAANTGVGGEAGSVTIPTAPVVAPIAGANTKNFYGYDLSAFAGAPDLGKVEQTIKQYVEDPGYAATLNSKLQTEYGYQTTWWKNIPQVNAVMLYAAVEWDPAVASSQNAFQSALANTDWWKTTTSNGRYWDEAAGTTGGPGSNISQGTDRAQVYQDLQNAQEKVLADANQIGVTLTKQQMDAIAYTYAKNNYQASGSFGSASGTAPEWLDQAITDTLFNIKGQQTGKIPLDFSTLAPGTSTFAQETPGGSPTGLRGIASQLYDKLQTVAQQYLMFNPTDPKSSLLSQQSIMNQVQSDLETYTGSGSSFGSSNLINGSVTKFTDQMKQQASRMYPSMAAAIAAGQTPQDYVAPYSQMIGSQLGVAPASINFTDPKWNWVIATPDAKTGQKTALTLDQVQQKLVTLPQWQQSNTAAQMGTDVTTSLNKSFGFGGA